MKFERKARQDIDLNLMPLIDVIFLLLIFFMVSTTFAKDSRLGLTLPESAIGAAQQTSVVEVVIDAQGSYKVDNVLLVPNSAVKLKEALSQYLQEHKQAGEPINEKSAADINLTITADAATEHQYVVTAMDIAGQLGFAKLSITTLKKE